MANGLAEYARKRDFNRTSEPKGKGAKKRAKLSKGGQFVIQKHDATRLHYDFRLEYDDALLSWAVPKGPSLDPDEKRLAIRVEDHPLEYATFEGTIPKGEYGAGTVLLWDRGQWQSKSDIVKGLDNGHLSFKLDGERLRGSWSLVRIRGDRENDKENWLLIKGDDANAQHGDKDGILRRHTESVESGRTLDDFANPRRATAKKKPADAPKARAKLPQALSPQLATLAAKAPLGDDWVHEIKYDGYRILAFCDGDSVRLITRNGKDWSDKFSAIQQALASLSLPGCIVDGELVASLNDGKTHFQSLQKAAKQEKGDYSLQFIAFDLPYARGANIQGLPLIERKELLKTLIGSPEHFHPDLRYSDHVIGHGDRVFKNACKLGLEGIVSKRSQSPYRNLRSRDWVKVKCELRQEFVICGFTEPAGSRQGFGALHLAYYQEEELIYAGKVGTGFNDRLLKKLRRQLENIALDACPLSEIPRDAGGTTWTRPEMVAEIRFAERTEDGLLRHASFLGLRPDKPASSVRWETAVEEVDSPQPRASKTGKPMKTNPGAQPKPHRRGSASGRNAPRPQLSNPDRILYPKAGYSKERVAEYYASVAKWMLPYVEKRPLSLLRHPRGWTEKGFFQKHIDDAFPEAVRRFDIADGGASSVYGYIDHADGLVALLQMGTLEIHTWGSRIDNVDRPDTIVMDLDPDDGLPSETVVGAALLLRDMLKEKVGWQSFLKTTGGKGLHLVIPIRRGPDWQTVKAFSKAVAESLKSLNPKAFTTVASKQKRKGKIYVDYLRNGRGATAIAPFSTRAREGATVAVPLSWHEAQPSLRSDQYSIDNVLRRLAQLKADPWLGYFDLKQGLTKAARRSFGLE